MKALKEKGSRGQSRMLSGKDSSIKNFHSTTETLKSSNPFGSIGSKIPLFGKEGRGEIL
jgi:hypothetical protein